MRNKAAALFDAGRAVRARGQHGEVPAAEAAWEAANACIDCHGGYGYAEEYDVERKFRECGSTRPRPSTRIS
jgi:acyl-CoA dehydrogenase